MYVATKTKKRYFSADIILFRKIIMSEWQDKYIYINEK